LKTSWKDEDEPNANQQEQGGKKEGQERRNFWSISVPGGKRANEAEMTRTRRIMVERLMEGLAAGQRGSPDQQANHQPAYDRLESGVSTRGSRCGAHV
jgi:hypothetical protein